MEPSQHPPDKLWTYDDLADVDYEGRKWEIFDGELVVSPAPLAQHQRAVCRLHILLHAALQKPRIAEIFIAPFDVILGRSKVVQPDILAIRWNRRVTSLVDGRVRLAPDLTIEVLSPSNRAHDNVRKRRFYARNGIPEYWIVDPEEQTIEVLERTELGLTYRVHGWYGPGDKAKSAGFGELEVDVDALFANEE
jgi:Uma2 family endonuclease